MNAPISPTKINPPRTRLQPTTEQEPTSVVGTAVAQLRALILSRPEDTLLGSEQDLVSYLKVSRSTFREAVQKLDAEQLLKVKRGVGGGYFSRRPSVDSVVYMASIYLSSQQPDSSELFEASSAIIEKAATLAASNPDSAARARLEEMLSREASVLQASDWPALSDVFHRFALTLGEISGNVVIRMFVDIILKIYRANASETILNAERAALLIDAHRELAQRVRSGDAEIAVIICQRIHQLTRSWLTEARREI